MLPVMFTLPGLGWEIRAYSAMLALALLLAWVVLLSLGRRDRMPTGPLGTAFVIGAALGLLGARIGWVLQQPGTAAGIGEVLVLRGDELAPFAGLVVAALASGVHVMRRRISVIEFYDVAAPALVAGAMVERLGALLAGHGFGDYAPGVPWAIRFPAGSPAYLEHQRALAGLLPAGAEQSLPVHPTQLYGVLLAGVTLAVAGWVRRRRRFSGQVFLVTSIVFLVLRALVEEWFRADASAAMLGPLNGGQVGALVIAAAMGVVLWSRGRLARHRPAAFRPWGADPAAATATAPPEGEDPRAAGPSSPSRGGAKGRRRSTSGPRRRKRARGKKRR